MVWMFVGATVVACGGMMKYVLNHVMPEEANKQKETQDSLAKDQGFVPVHTR
ncbi:MAG TPA: hypothetical protein VEY51_10450 [Chondromyces sp.]|nr:hypothetical protein [Chondromyces sp.]